MESTNRIFPSETSTASEPIDLTMDAFRPVSYVILPLLSASGLLTGRFCFCGERHITQTTASEPIDLTMDAFRPVEPPLRPRMDSGPAPKEASFTVCVRSFDRALLFLW